MMTALAAQAAGPLRVELSMEAPKNYFSEKCFTLDRGQRLSYELRTPHAIDFNLHHHPADGDVVYPDKRIVKSQHSNRIVAESAGVYCFMATNVGDYPSAYQVVIDYEITAL